LKGVLEPSSQAVRLSKAMAATTVAVEAVRGGSRSEVHVALDGKEVDGIIETIREAGRMGSLDENELRRKLHAYRLQKRPTASQFYDDKAGPMADFEAQVWARLKNHIENGTRISVAPRSESELELSPCVVNAMVRYYARSKNSLLSKQEERDLIISLKNIRRQKAFNNTFYDKTAGPKAELMAQVMARVWEYLKYGEEL